MSHPKIAIDRPKREAAEALEAAEFNLEQTRIEFIAAGQNLKLWNLRNAAALSALIAVMPTGTDLKVRRGYMANSQEQRRAIAAGEVVDPAAVTVKHQSVLDAVMSNGRRGDAGARNNGIRKFRGLVPLAHR
jgi:hypothetical protein